MEKHQRVGVGGFLYQDGKVLITKRADNESFLAGHWDIPGGKSEFGEEPVTALEREFLEETGLSVSVGKPYHIFSFMDHDGARQIVDIIFLVKQEGAREITLSKEHSAYAWVTKDDLDQYELTPEMKTCILKGFEEYGQ